MNTTQFDIPLSLQESCMNALCDNLSVLCKQHSESEDSQHKKLVFKDPETFLNTELSELLLERLIKRRKLNDEVLSLFTPEVTNLSQVSIINSPVTGPGLHVLKGHHLTHLEVTELELSNDGVLAADIFECMGDWTKSHLRVLKIRGSRLDGPGDQANAVLMSLKHLSNLHTLDVSYTNFSQEGLDIIVENLPCLEVLDISRTCVYDISPLLKFKTRLKLLSIHSLFFSPGSDPVNTVIQFDALVHLDVSHIPDFLRGQTDDRGPFSLRDYLLRHDANPNLVSLDISGANGIEPSSLRSYLEAHNELKFLGLVNSNLADCEIFHPESSWHKARPELRIAGDAAEEQVMETLRHYTSRSDCIQIALVMMQQITEDDEDVPREDVIQLILAAINRHQTVLDVQKAGVPCLQNITNEDICSKIHPKLLSECVYATLAAMENFPLEHGLQRDGLEILCNGDLLQLKFEMFRCYEVAMTSLHNFDDAYMCELSIWVCLYIAIQCTVQEIAIIGPNETNMEKLLALVHERIGAYETDDTLTNTVGLIWSLTEDCPETCKVFLENDGYTIMKEVLDISKSCRTENCLELRLYVLGVLSGVAAVPNLCHHLMEGEFIECMRGTLLGKDDNISFFAAFILTRLCMLGDTPWANIHGLTRNDIVGDLQMTISNWDLSQKNLGRFRTFRSMYQIMESPEPVLHLWGVWAIHYFCYVEGNYYLPLLDKEDGQKYLMHLIQSGTADPVVRDMCMEVIRRLVDHQANKSLRTQNSWN